MTQNETELKPCPFCGGGNIMVFEAKQDTRHFPIARCMTCYSECDGDNFDFSSEGVTAIKRWNTRAEPKPCADVNDTNVVSMGESGSGVDSNTSGADAVECARSVSRLIPDSEHLDYDEKEITAIIQQYRKREFALGVKAGMDKTDHLWAEEEAKLIVRIAELEKQRDDLADAAFLVIGASVPSPQGDQLAEVQSWRLSKLSDAIMKVSTSYQQELSEKKSGK